MPDPKPPEVPVSVLEEPEEPNPNPDPEESVPPSDDEDKKKDAGKGDAPAPTPKGKGKGKDKDDDKSKGTDPMVQLAEHLGKTIVSPSWEKLEGAIEDYAMSKVSQGVGKLKDKVKGAAIEGVKMAADAYTGGGYSAANEASGGALDNKLSATMSDSSTSPTPSASGMPSQPGSMSPAPPSKGADQVLEHGTPEMKMK